jgi:uncharacterized protein (TIGR02466 family)
MEIQNMFPTPIGYLKDSNFTNKVLPIAKDILEKTPKHRWGYTTTFENNQITQHLESYDWIVSYVMNISKDFINRTGFRYKEHPKIQSIFVSKINNTEFHGRHTHPNSVVSGVMYLETTPNCAPIVIEDPRSVRAFNGLMRDNKMYVTNQDTVAFFPKQGDILLLEAWVPHQVPKVEQEGNRITLVFNIGY